MKILMVCLGNICRSPMADGLLRHKVKLNNLDVIVDSAGTSGHHQGDQPDFRMQKTAKSKGYDLSQLKSRQFIEADFDEFDLIFAMDKSNLNNMKKLARNNDDISKLKLILNEDEPKMDLEVPDPYYGGDQGFEDVFQMLDSATDQIIEKIKKGTYSI